MKRNRKTKQQIKIISILFAFVLLLPNIFGLGVTAVGETAGISDSIVITEPTPSLEKNIKNGTQFVIMCSFKNIASFDGRVFKITYVPSHAELIDFAAQTSKIDINVGTVPDTDLEIISHNTSTGELTFKINKAVPANKLWSGTAAILLFNAKITGTTIFYAQWTGANVAVNFFMNDNTTAEYTTGNIDNANKKDTDKITKPVNPYREGYVFGGWYLDDKYTVQWNLDNTLSLVNGVQESSGDYYLNLYAKWTIANVAVNFFNNYDSNAPYTAGNLINANKKYFDVTTQPNEPKREFYTFGGWYLDDKCTAKWDFSKTLTVANGVQGDSSGYFINLYANWILVDVAVNFYMNDYENTPYEAGNIINTNKKYYDATEKPDAPSRSFYIFGGWYIDAECTMEWDFDNALTLENGVQGDNSGYYLNIYAKWIPNPPYPVYPNLDEPAPKDTTEFTPLPEDKNTIEINGNIITTQKDNAPVKNKDGSYTLPGGGEIKTPNGVIIIAPAGTLITADGKVSFPNGGSIKLIYGSHTFNINKNTVIILDSKIPLGYSVIIDNSFTDVKKNEWFYDDVMYVYSHGLMGSTSTEDMLFSPNTPLTRGMIVTVLYRLAGSPDVSGLTNPFTDVSSNTWYTDAVKWAVENKIVNGYGNGKFGPDDNIIRQDMAVILMRYMGFIKYEYIVTEEYRVFADEDKIDDYAKNAVQVLNKLGIINGKGNNVIDPKGMATRAEVAAMLHRFLVNLK